MLAPCIAALPFFFRAMQCLRRYRDTREPKHLFNFGKYMASLLVVFVGSYLSTHGYAVLFVSVFATVYAATWDVAMDWGLTLRDVSPWKRAESYMYEGHESAQTSVVVADDATRRQSAKFERHFGAHTYLLAALLDIVARFSWVQTLMPTSVLTNDILGKEALSIGTAALEIARRSMWAVLRIEWEQVSNASGFRTLLWVPAKLHTETMVARLNPLAMADGRSGRNPPSPAGTPPLSRGEVVPESGAIPSYCSPPRKLPPGASSFKATVSMTEKAPAKEAAASPPGASAASTAASSVEPGARDCSGGSAYSFCEPRQPGANGHSSGSAQPLLGTAQPLLEPM